MDTCSTNNKLIAQTLFLGSSISSFSCNLGWSGQPSQLTVQLADDLPKNPGFPCNFDRQFPQAASNTVDGDNYYYTCSGDSCYIDRDGSTWSSGNIGLNRNDGSRIDADDKLLPGKLYYEFNAAVTDPFVSKYYYYPDPGFLGNPNRVDLNGGFTYATGTVNSGYDIIGTPVYFKMGHFTFGGIVQSWEENFGSGGNQYKVVVEGMQSVLSNCHIIVGEYSGSIFSLQSSNNTFGSPKNYIGNKLTYNGTIAQGNIPNVFNVYGFLESSAPENYGGSNCNDEGMSAKEIIAALRVLTGTVANLTTGANRLKDRANILSDNFSPKTAFSPYGRILVKCMQKNYTFETISSTFRKLGVIPPQANLEDDRLYCEFLLDLSEIPNPPDDFRIKGPVISITDFLNQITEAIGYDYTVDLLPVAANNRIYNVIKIKTISRRKQTTPNQISNTIKSLYYHGYNIASSTMGKEKNESPARCVIIGGKQQRLLQAKSYRLSYTQCNIIYDARNKKFVDYIGLGSINIAGSSGAGAGISRTAKHSTFPNFGYGKIRFPSFLSTRNVDLNNIISPTLSGVLIDEGTIRNSVEGINFSSTDNIWPDKQIINSEAEDKNCGNYEKAIQGDYPLSNNWGISATPSYIGGISVNPTQYGGTNQIRTERFFPLHKDVICPFFGYIADNEYDIDTTKSTSSADFRRPRPVFFDTWTGQICVMFRASELPATRINLEGLYGGMSGLQRASSLYSFNTMTRSNPTQFSSPDPGPGPGSPPTTPTTTSQPSSANTINFPSSSAAREHYFVVTESEMRAAMMGPDELLVYSCAKTYKTDLYLMMNEAYFRYYRDQYIAYGNDATLAAQKAREKCDWHWRLQQTNISNQVLSPAALAPDKPSGAEFVPEEVRKDFELIQKFIKGVAEQYYGRKYMVKAPYLGAKRDQSFADIQLPTQAGYAYVFRGDNKLKYSYEPTNQGAWEEYGNIIDDCIAVGSKFWMNLSDDQGLIQPIVGYNATDRFDHVSYNLCQQNIAQSEFNQKLSPAFQNDQWTQAKIEKADSTCPKEDFVFPSIDVASLTDTRRYVVVSPQKVAAGASFNPIRSGYSSFNQNLLAAGIPEPNAFGVDVPFNRKKLFHVTDVEEKFVFLNPETLEDPRILISAPGIPINSSSREYQKDPNATVLATIAVEDAAVYLRSTHPSAWDFDFLDMLSSYVEKAGPKGYLFGVNSNLSKNTSAQNVSLKPKMLHPFFAGIPIKSNQYCYGPWANYPMFDYPSNRDDIFPSGNIVNLDYTSFPLAISSGVITYGNPEATRAINNWIYPTNVSVNPEFVPWNYGGMSYLDDIAIREVKSKVNYQPIIETASVEMAGLPLFNLGGSFNERILNDQLPISGIYYETFGFKEYKRTTNPLLMGLGINNINTLNAIDRLTYQSGALTYNVISLPYKADSLDGPIISTIGVDVTQNGIKSNYMFRTYTRKLSLFNKEYADKIKKFTKENLSRQKELAKIDQQIFNKVNGENLSILEQRSAKSLSGGEMASKLVAWSPVEVIVASAGGYLKEPNRNPPYSLPYNSQTMPFGLDSSSTSASATYFMSADNDIGTTGMFADGFNDSQTQIPTLSQMTRIRTTAQIYQRTELGDFISKDYGTKSVMSLDGVFSPVSFYPTNNLSTFAFSKYHKNTCPVCLGSGKRTLTYRKFSAGSVVGATGSYDLVCEACCENNQKLHSSLYSAKTQLNAGAEKLPPYIVTSGSDISILSNFSRSRSNSSANQIIPINLVSLQPLIVPYSEFRNPNVQNYTGAHPEGYHPVLSLNSKNRNFIDRARHSISIVGRSAVHQNSIEIHNNINDDRFILSYGTNTRYNADFFHKDIALIKDAGMLDSTIAGADYDNNQRFIGLRGPLVMHGWGYDTEGFPVPNAADEPLEVDEYNRPKRFKLNRTPSSVATTWDQLSVGDIFVIVGSEAPAQEMIKSISLNLQNTLGNNRGTNITKATSVKKVKYEDDLSDVGGFDPNLYTGSIISKTQAYINGQWTAKLKMKEFYLNWGERSDLWPVGPIDLRWDAGRRVWTADTTKIYKMVYVTLEEDLIKDDDVDDTYPARGFLDDLEYSTQPLGRGLRRVVFIKDRSGYTAPRGAKLLCRYDNDTGFYEPVSKSSFVAKGTISPGTNNANIEMSYAPGKKKGEPYPTMMVSFDNPFNLPTTENKGLFTFLNSKWILTTSK